MYEPHRHNTGLPATLEVVGKIRSGHPVSALLEGGVSPRVRQTLSAQETSPSDPEWLPVAPGDLRWWFERGADVWLNQQSDAVFVRPNSTFVWRTAPWINAEEAVEVAEAAPCYRLPVYFGRREVTIWVEPVESGFVYCVESARALQYAGDRSSAVALLEVARYGMLANAPSLGFSGQGEGPVAKAGGELLFLLSGLTDSDVARSARAARSVASAGSSPRLKPAIVPFSVARPVPTDTFAALPREIVDRVGFVVQRGTLAGEAKLDLAILAAHVRLWQRNAGRERTLDYANGTKIELSDFEYVASEQRIAQVIHEHVLYRRVRAADPLDDPDFRRTYERVHDGHKRLKKLFVDGRAVLTDLGPTVEGKIKKGKRWSLAGGPLAASCDDDALGPVAPLVFAHRTPDLVCTQDAAVDVAARLTELIAASPDFVRDFEWCRGRTALEGQRGRIVRGIQWAQRQAKRDPSGHRHMTTALFRKAELDIPGAPCLVPWVVADVERGNDIEAAHAATVRLLRDLWMLGANMSQILAHYTGGRGFHVRIPCGALGTPVFRDARLVSRILGRFVGLLTKERIDTGVLAPGRCIRTIGSQHEKTGLAAVGMTADRFLRTDLDLLDTVAQHHYPFDLSDPRDADPVPALVALLEEAARRDTVGSGPSVSSKIIVALMGGVSEGEPWFGDIVGRNEAALRYAVHLSHRPVPMDEIWGELQRWNSANRPPLPLRELKAVLVSAGRYAGRDGEARSVHAPQTLYSDRG